jgi:hypothetical protein
VEQEGCIICNTTAVEKNKEEMELGNILNSEIRNVILHNA